ncbi:MAG: N-6 DNA methylase, partial [Bradymonadaceae bacterium]|nr:N-6 DNA methylase [Lujinxingiaceae bacterium]
RWIADFLARACLAGEPLNKVPSVCDPAVGGGQMLLAAFDALRQNYPQASLLALVGALHGCDLDARAVTMARRGLKLRVAQVHGARHRSAEACIDRQLVVGDGLFGPLERHDIVLTNPPYMGARSMPVALKERLRAEWQPFHGDLYLAFLRRCQQIARRSVGVLAQQTVWYLASYTEARRLLLEHGQLEIFLHLGPHAFVNLNGEKASVVAYVQRVDRSASKEQTAVFIDLREHKTPDKKRAALSRLLHNDASETQRPETRSIALSSFAQIPASPLAHWLPPALAGWFGRAATTLGELAEIPGSQNKTGDNARFVRRFESVDPAQITNAEGLWTSGDPEQARWRFYSKGGSYAPWWGNWQHVVDWSPQARAFYASHRTANLLDERFWAREGLCYTDFCGDHFNARWMPAHCLFDMSGPAIFARTTTDERRRLLALMALLNSTPARALLNAMNPSLHCQVRELRLLPIPSWDDAIEARLAQSAQTLVETIREMAHMVPGDPLYVAGLRAHERDGALAALQGYAVAERALDCMVCELYGCPELVDSTQQREHATVMAVRAVLSRAAGRDGEPGRSE